MVKQKKSKRKYIGITACIAVAVAFSMIVTVFAVSQNDKTIFTLNGYKITQDEFVLFWQNSKALTASYFKQKYNADYDKDFWTNTYNGENPSEYAKQKTMDELIKIKSEQILMKEKGIIEEVSYDTFLNRLREENEQRQKKIKANQPVYGPTQYSAFEYYSYYQSMNRQKLIEKLMKDPEYVMPDEFYEKYYESIKDAYFKNGEVIEYEKIAVKDGPAAKDILKNIGSKVMTGKLNLEEAAKGSEVSVKVEKHTLDLNTVSKEDALSNHLYEELRSLKAGDFSNVFKAEDEQIILRLNEAKNKGYKAYKEVKSITVQIWVQNQLDEKLKQYVKDARVEVNHVTYDKIKLK